MDKSIQNQTFPNDSSKDELSKDFFENLRQPLPNENNFSFFDTSYHRKKLDKVKNKRKLIFFVIFAFIFLSALAGVGIILSYGASYPVYSKKEINSENHLEQQSMMVDDIYEIQHIFDEASLDEKNNRHIDGFKKRIHGVNNYIQHKEYKRALKQSLNNEKILKTIFKDEYNDDISLLRIKHHNLLSEIYYRLNKLPQARKQSDQALRDTLIVYGTKHYETAKQYDLLAFYLDAIGETNEALMLYHNSIDVRLGLSNADEGKLITDMNNLGEDYRALGMYDESRLVLMKAIKMVEKKFGIHAIELAIILNNLGLTEQASENGVLSMSYLQQAYKIAHEKYGSQHELSKVIAKNITNLRGF